MLTILEVLRLAAEYLQKKGIDSPRINSELMLASVLSCTRMELYLKFDKPMAEKEVDIFRELLKRRSRFEPVQYILGYTDFYGIRLKADRRGLIPRPETELLVETVLEIFKEEGEKQILDIGTGTGNIAISLAVNRNDFFVTGLDINKFALGLARENCSLHNLGGRINLICQDVFQNGLIFHQRFDAIVSNPPYVSSAEYKNLQREIRLYEPENAVSDFGDGYAFYRRIIDISPELLKKGGYLFFENGKDQSPQVKQLMHERGFGNIGIRKDYSGIERVIFGVLL